MCVFVVWRTIACIYGSRLLLLHWGYLTCRIFVSFLCFSVISCIMSCQVDGQFPPFLVCHSVAIVRIAKYLRHKNVIFMVKCIFISKYLPILTSNVPPSLPRRWVLRQVGRGFHLLPSMQSVIVRRFWFIPLAWSSKTESHPVKGCAHGYP